MNSEVVNWISIIGSILSLTGVGIAIWQISLVKKAAVAAKEGADQTQKTEFLKIFYFQMFICTKNLEEIQSFVRYERYESAQIRTGDLISYLYQIQQRTKNSQQTLEIKYEEMLSEL
jgi:hypothetical protein